MRCLAFADFAFELLDDELAALWLMPAAAPASTHVLATAIAATFLPFFIGITPLFRRPGTFPGDMRGASRRPV
jgi:hypothetical protein